MHPSIQSRFLELILKKFQKKSEAVDTLSELLNIGKDGVYRRLRGDTYLTPDEIAILAETYKVSFDSLIFKQSDTLLFSYNMMSKKINSFHDYAEQLHENISSVLKMPGAHLLYATHEIPLFQFFFYPELTIFKFYIYGLTSWNFDFLKNQSFHFGLVPQPTLDLAVELGKQYHQLPSQELWAISVVDNTLHQLEYLIAIDKFENPADALLLCDQLTALINHTKQMAIAEKKFAPHTTAGEKNAAYGLYYNEFASTNNTILVKTDASNLLFTTFGNPNFLSTIDQPLCKEYENWYNALVNNATALSTGRNKETFFNILEKKISATRNRIEEN